MATRHEANAVKRHDLSVLMDPTEVSQYLGVPTGTLANWRYQRRGPAFVRVGRHVRYRAEDVAEWIAQRAVDGEPGLRDRPSAFRAVGS